MTKCAPHEALKSITTGRLTFDERVVLRRVAAEPCPLAETSAAEISNTLLQAR